VERITDWGDKVVPPIMDILVHERDEFMVQRLRQLQAGSTAVAVVGVGHVAGIEKRWQQLEGVN